jgi:hypothetical protein
MPPVPVRFTNCVSVRAAPRLRGRRKKLGLLGLLLISRKAIHSGAVGPWQNSGEHCASPKFHRTGEKSISPVPSKGLALRGGLSRKGSVTTQADMA